MVTLTSLSLISQLNIPGLSFLYSSILFSTSGVATRGLLPPITPGLILPVSWYLIIGTNWNDLLNKLPLNYYWYEAQVKSGQIRMKLQLRYLFRILETHPWLTLNCLLITQGLTPAAAISTILSRIWLGRGRPLMKTPPSWLTLPCPWKG